MEYHTRNMVLCDAGRLSHKKGVFTTFTSPVVNTWRTCVQVSLAK
jgi:hypothetical protein